MISWVQLLCVTQILLIAVSHAVVFPLDKDNYSTTRDGYRFMLISFSAEWCRFSKMLKPIFEEASEKIVNLTSTGVAAFGIVDCVANSDICVAEKIRKYPTVKYSLFGEIQPHEYRDARNVDALLKFVNDRIKDDITYIDGQHKPYTEALALVKNPTTTTIVGLFPTIDPANLHQQYFKRAAMIYRHNCRFSLIHNLSDAEDRMVHMEEYTNAVKEVTVLQNADYASLGNWVKPRCVQLVRELSFDNAEEITDEGLELLILFYLPEKHGHLKYMFTQFVKQHMQGEIGKLNFVVADGKTFSHPLMHMGKTEADLPQLTFDSLAHMYPLKVVVEQALDVNQPQIMLQLVQDLYSGKLHREFHFGPDAENKQPDTKQPDSQQPDKTQPGTADTKPDSRLPDVDVITQPPESAMKKLSPSRLRYTLLHDEF